MRKSREIRAINLVKSNSIKLHRFLPSKREIWTVVGNDGDQLVDDSQPYCSCRDFHFRFLTDEEDECYHLLALKYSKSLKHYDTIIFQDNEYLPFIKNLVKELPHKG
jgi:predicted nucleic acid-binding Zn finger protein